MATAYSYIRFSSKPQEQGDSLRRQLQGTIDYCREHGLTLSDKSYQDLGISGFKDISRPELSELLTAVDNGIIRPGDYIILESLDRLSRKGIDATHQVLRKILISDVIVVSLYDGLKLNSDSLNNLADIMRIAVGADLGHQESKKKSERGKSRWKEKQKQARDRKLPKTSRCPSWLTLNAEKSGFLVDESKAETVREIFEMAAAGIGRRRICELLTLNKTAHISTSGRSKGKWYPSYLQKLFTNGAVIGSFTPTIIDDSGKRVPDHTNTIENYFPPIVSHDLYQRLQARMKIAGKTYGGRRGKNMSNLFQGLAYCEKCGGVMSLTVKNKAKNERYLRCIESLHARCKHRTNYRYGLIEAGVLETLKRVRPLEDPDQQNTIREGLASLENQIDALTTRITGLIDASGVPEVAEKINTLSAERDKLRLEVDELNSAQTAITSKDVEVTFINLDCEKLSEDLVARTKINTVMKSVGLQLLFDEGKIVLKTGNNSRRLSGYVFDQKIAEYEYAQKLLSCFSFVTEEDTEVLARDLRYVDTELGNLGIEQSSDPAAVMFEEESILREYKVPLLDVVLESGMVSIKEF